MYILTDNQSNCMIYPSWCVVCKTAIKQKLCSIIDGVAGSQNPWQQTKTNPAQFYKTYYNPNEQRKAAFF